MTLISYAQNGEDIILWRALRHVEHGFYIDIGACDPHDLSVTKLFYDRGWSGINVEPSKEFHDRCVANRPRDVNLNLAVAEQAGELRFLNVDGTGLSTLLPDNAASAVARGFEVQERTVSAVPLADICSIAADRDVHFLKIDVEGSERSVLAGGDFQRFRPWIVVVEATRPNSQDRNDAEWRDILLNAGYEQAYFDGINLYFIAREHLELRERLAIQPSVLDHYQPLLMAQMQTRLSELENAAKQDEAALQEALRHGSAVEAALTQARAQHSAAETEARQLSEALEQEYQDRALHEAALADLCTRVEQSIAERNQLDGTLQGLPGPDTGTGGLLTRRLETAFALHGQILATTEAQLSQIKEMQRQLIVSTSWRVTAPLRAVKRILSKPAGVERRSGPVGKELARRVFKLGMQAALSVPGARRGVRLAFRLAPQPVQWLALRYRAYSNRGLSLSFVEEGVPLTPVPPPAGPMPESVSILMGDLNVTDMSVEEARIHRQLVVTTSLTSQNV